MSTIPVIGTAVVKNPHWTRRLYLSIDFPVNNFVVFNNNGKGEIDEELDTLKELDHPFVKNLKIVHMPSNIGVAASWNLIIKSYLMSPFWIIVNDDVAFTPGFLREMFEASQNIEVGMVHGYGGDFGLGSYDLFLIKDWVVQKLGLFDENLYPAYCEDADYIMRLRHNDINAVKDLTKRYLHGDGYCDEYYTHGSQTKKSSSDLAKKLDEVNVSNFDYLTEKWGEGWRMADPFKYPFNNKDFSLTTTTFDLNFARSKYLGF